ncbi:MAG: hypothetical protein KF857_01680 [Fimbriimonadaceae bacterium]|nr:hypothetical protein [Fimbriimonadaceae bacterium]
MRRRGFTVIELLMVMVMTATLMIGLTTVFSSALATLRRAPDLDQKLEQGRRFEKRVTQFLRGAYVTADNADTLTYFVASNQSGSTSKPDTIVFTTTSAPLNMAAIDDTEHDWQQKNEEYGPQGGLTEVSLSLTAVGSDATGSGLYLRTQRPADGDPTQGGYESLLLAGVTDISFEFWDGTEWTDTWDTTTGVRRLPAVVRITYTLDGETDSRVMTVRLEQSDVTSTNPVVQL